MCVHRPVYAGVVHVKVRGVLEGVVDVWRCRLCGEFFAEARPIAMTTPPSSVGFVKPEGSEPALLACVGERVLWELTYVRPGEFIAHRCPDGLEPRLKVLDGLSLEEECVGRHRLYPLSRLVNQVLNLG